MEALTIFLLATVLLLLLIRHSKKRSDSLPPGPPGLPIIGNNHQLIKNAPQKFSEWASKYGKLYTIRIGNCQTALVVSDADLMKELFSMSAATGHFESEITSQVFPGSRGLLNAEGSNWQQHRNFCFKSLREFGFGNRSQMEPTILSEALDLRQLIDEQISMLPSIRLSDIMKETSGNIVWAMVTGEKMKTNMSQLTDTLMDSLQTVSKSGLPFFSWIKYIAPDISGYNAYVRACNNLQDFVWKYFNDHKMLREQGLVHHDVISAYMNHVENMQDKTSIFYGKDGMQASVNSVLGLLLAGGEATSTSLHWLIFYLASFPDVQQKLQNEIDDVVGQNENPSLAHRVKMPYTCAVIEETLRKSSVVPFGIIHRLIEDVTFHNYKLPKGLLLVQNLYHVNHDKHIWNDPHNFRPERFLEDGSQTNNAKFDTKMQKFMVSFQPGRKTCLGESLARDIMFLFTATLFQKLNFSPQPERQVTDYLEPERGYLLKPKNLLVIATHRNQDKTTQSI